VDIFFLTAGNFDLEFIENNQAAKQNFINGHNLSLTGMDI
jgi:hypothetical protein